MDMNVHIKTISSIVVISIVILNILFLLPIAGRILGLLRSGFYCGTLWGLHTPEAKLIHQGMRLLIDHSDGEFLLRVGASIPRIGKQSTMDAPPETIYALCYTLHWLFVVSCWSA